MPDDSEQIIKYNYPQQQQQSVSPLGMLIMAPFLIGSFLLGGVATGATQIVNHIPMLPKRHPLKTQITLREIDDKLWE